MDTIQALVIVAVAALIHASFQLSVSMLTLLSSHTIGKKRRHGAVIRLTNSFVFGVGVMTMLLLSTVSLIVTAASRGSVQSIDWIIGCGLLMGLGVAVWFFYYRKEDGTMLWIPRGIARYMAERTKATSGSAEAFSLGLMSVIGELLFVLVPIVVSALVLVGLSPSWQITGVFLYTGVSSLSLLIVNGLIGSGHKISQIQKWREENKRFLQFAAGSGLIVLGFYIYVNEVLATAVYASGGF